MENRKGSGIFLGIIGVATLVVAIIGATFAYFSATAQSNEGAVAAQSASLALGFGDDGAGLRTNLIPASQQIALYAGTQQTGHGSTHNQQCVDDNANEVCSVYEFTVGNPSKTTAMDINASIVVSVNEFTNLKFAVYELDRTTGAVGNQVVAPTAFVDGTSTYPLAGVAQHLMPSSAAADADATLDPANPASYTLVTDTYNSAPAYNKSSYRVIVWVDEIDADQTDDDSNKTFAAQVVITTGSGNSGVTGVLAAASPANNNPPESSSGE